VILVALSVVVLGTYFPLMLNAADGHHWARIAGALEALLFVVGAGFASLVGLVYLGLRCDDTCAEGVEPVTAREEWWRFFDSPEWTWQAVLVLSALAFALATFVLPLLHRYHLAVAAAVIGLGLFCAWALLMAPLGDQFGI
jgi:hypothetical protein